MNPTSTSLHQILTAASNCSTSPQAALQPAPVALFYESEVCKVTHPTEFDTGDTEAVLAMGTAGTAGHVLYVLLTNSRK